jgi:hypothetical protein
MHFYSGPLMHFLSGVDTSFLGKVEIASLGNSGASVAIISALGIEAIIGRNLMRRFHISLEYGKRIRIRP